MSTLELDPQTDQQLAELATLTGEAPAEIVRRAVTAYAHEIAGADGAIDLAGHRHQLAAALEAAARINPFAGQDGVQWQREQRADRPLPGRKE